jgi:hypothetical protein
MSTKVYVGIDPGRKGAMAIIDVHGAIVHVFDAPLSKVDRSGYNRPLALSYAKVVAAFPERSVAVELVSGMPTDSPQWAFNFGVGTEVWRSALSAAEVRFEEIHSNKWKARLCLPGKKSDPQACRLAFELARQTFPNFGQYVKWVTKDSGRIDALLIAHYLRTRSVEGMRSIVEQYGKDSPQAWTAILGGLNKHNRRGRLPRPGSIT